MALEHPGTPRKTWNTPMGPAVATCSPNPPQPPHCMSGRAPCAVTSPLPVPSNCHAPTCTPVRPVCTQNSPQGLLLHTNHCSTCPQPQPLHLACPTHSQRSLATLLQTNPTPRHVPQYIPHVLLRPANTPKSVEVHQNCSSQKTLTPLLQSGPGGCCGAPPSSFAWLTLPACGHAPSHSLLSVPVQPLCTPNAPQNGPRCPPKPPHHPHEGLCPFCSFAQAMPGLMDGLCHSGQ